jgi:hypothetical protein
VTPETGRRDTAHTTALVVIAALLGVILGTATVALFDGSSASSADEPTSKTAVDVAACTQAMWRADAVIAGSRVLRDTLARQTRVMNDLLAHRVTERQAVDSTLPGLVHATQQSSRLDQDAAAYREAARDCRVR